MINGIGALIFLALSTILTGQVGACSLGLPKFWFNMLFVYFWVTIIIGSPVAHSISGQ